MERAILVDFDGTLVDSVPQLYNIYEKFLMNYDKVGSIDEFESFLGPSLSEVIRGLKNSHSLPADETELVKLFHELAHEEYGLVEPSIGAVKLLKNADKKGWKVVIVTSNSVKVVKNWLEANNIERLVHGVIDERTCLFGKPHPAPYLKGLEIANADASLSLAIDDTRDGITSAVKAGVKSFLRRHDYNSTHVASDAEASIYDLSELIDYMI